MPGSSPRLVSVTPAPFCPEPDAACDPRVAFVIVPRPAEEDQLAPPSPFPGLVGRSPALVAPVLPAGASAPAKKKRREGC